MKRENSAPTMKDVAKEAGVALLIPNTRDPFFASIAWDFNGDGKVTVQVHQYVNNSQSPDGDRLLYGYASEISLIGDLNDCESYYFILDNPSKFQRDFHILAMPDGSSPSAFSGRLLAAHCSRSYTGQ